MTEKARSGPARLWRSFHGWVQFIVTAGLAVTLLWGFHMWSVKIGEERGTRAVIQRLIPERVDSLEAAVFSPGHLRARVTEIEATISAIRDEYNTVQLMRQDIRELNAKFDRFVCLSEVQQDLRPAFECAR